MNKREYVRYDTRAFPGNMGEAAISWQGQSEIASAVANCSAHGIKVSIAHSLAPPDLPKKKDIVKVRMPIDDMWFTGMCIFAAKEADGSVSMGIYFYKPEEQNYLKDLLFKALEAPSSPDSFVSYQWEELVARLCDSDDPELKRIGQDKRRALSQESCSRQN